MNPRIFKKLTKAAAKEIDRLNIAIGQRFEVANEEDPPEITRIYKWERKSFYGKEWSLTNNHNVKILDGVVGYGQIEGYYDPEWCDNDALSLLYTNVIDRFVDWKNFNGEGWPEVKNHRKYTKTAVALINYAKTLKKGKG